MAADPLGRAMLDYQRGGLRGDCVARDGDDTNPGAIHGNYFNAREEWPEDTFAVLERLSGPVVDVGCGAGQHALWFQDHGVEVVGVDVSPCAVAAARERGVADVREMDMFDLSFPRDRFRSALVNGTQIGLAGSLAGVSEFLADLAFVTDADGVAAVDNYHPPALDPDAFFGYRPDPRDGVARRACHFEYDRDGDREVGRTLDFVLFSPDRLAEAAIGTPWRLDDVHWREGYYTAVLTK